MMRAKASVVSAGFFLLVFTASVLSVSAAEQTISGTILSESGDLGCEHCMVSLLAAGGRPVGTAYLDLAGHFTFEGVPSGSYVIHAEIPGFEEINQAVNFQ